MIQRIQTVFLLASLGFLISMFFSPFSGLVAESGNVCTLSLAGICQNADNVQNFSPKYLLLALGILICLSNLVIIFMYQRRVLQSRLCIYNIVLLTGLLGAMLYAAYGEENMVTVSYRLPFVFPVISIIFHYLAFRGIRKDETAVQALNRLR